MSARSYTNSSKGDGATYNQRLQRIKWTNVINIYRALRAFLQHAYEGSVTSNSGATNLSYYNRFVKANLASSDIVMPKDYAEQGACYLAPYVVGRGSLKSVAIQSTGITDIAVSFADGLLSSQTIGAVSQSIINNNDGYENGDKITFAALYRQNVVVGDTSYPMVKARYIEFNLDTANENEMSTLFGQWTLSASGAKLAITVSFDSQMADAFMAVHTRRYSGGILASNQQIVLRTAASPTTDEWLRQSMDSYGYRPDELIDPNTYSTGGSEPVTPQYVLSIQSVGRGSVTLSPEGGTYDAGTSVTATCVPDTGKDFIEWSDGNTDNPRVFVMTRNISVTATFEE